MRHSGSGRRFWQLGCVAHTGDAWRFSHGVNTHGFTLGYYRPRLRRRGFAAERGCGEAQPQPTRWGNPLTIFRLPSGLRSGCDWSCGHSRAPGASPRHGGENGRVGDGSKAFNAAGIFRPTNFQNSICAASSNFSWPIQFHPAARLAYNQQPY